MSELIKIIELTIILLTFGLIIKWHNEHADKINQKKKGENK